MALTIYLKLDLGALVLHNLSSQLNSSRRFVDPRHVGKAKMILSKMEIAILVFDHKKIVMLVLLTS